MSLLITRRGDVRRLNHVLDQAFNSWPFASVSQDYAAPAWVPAADVIEVADGHQVVVELPGLKAEDVKIKLENFVLSISGEKKQVKEENGKVRRFERSYGAFERSFTLPNTVDADKVSARFENGVLTVSIPKAEQAKPREIQVKVS